MNRKFDHTAPPPTMPPGASIDRAIPIRAPEVSGDVLVPLLRAVISGAMLAALGSVAALVLALPWWVPLGTAGLVSVAVWFYCGLSDKLLYASEVIAGHDLDGDGQVGRPSFEIVEVTPGEYGNNLKMFDLPGEVEDFAKVCYNTLTGASLTQAAWTGKGNPYTKGDWTRLCDAMVARDWWAWNNPDYHPSGIAPLPEGKRKMAQWLEEYGSRTNTHVQETVAQIEPPAR